MIPPTLILASGSPRRRMLLEMAGFDVADVRPPDVPEVRVSAEAPVTYCRRLSVDKARAVHAEHAWILAADTIVHRGDTIFEKPLDDLDAMRMLSALAPARRSNGMLERANPGTSTLDHTRALFERL